MPPPTAVVPHIPFTEVSTENFGGLYSAILEKVSRSKYVAFDTEFTGHCQRIAKNMEDRYEALAAVVRTHAILSFGMTTIEKTNEKHYVAHNFEFLASNQNPFQVNPSNMKFLAENGLDLNRHFSVGLPYCAGSQSMSRERNLRSLWRQILVTLRKQEAAIIVHNGLLDLMYLYQSFIAELPKKLHTFVMDLVEMFPGGIYDTKHLADDLLNEQKTFLAYLYCKYDRTQKENNTFTIEVQEALIPVAGEVAITDKRKLDDDSITETMALSKSQKRRKRALKQKTTEGKATSRICYAYANRGWCEQGKRCERLHDLDLILDEDQGITREKEIMEEENNTVEVISAAESIIVEKGAIEQEDPKQRRDHAAHFDAYMTAYVFCHIISSLGDATIQSHINRVNLMRLNVPLRITKSQYAKPSPGWIEVRDTLEA
ncbi:Target of EGR1, member 1 (Nuclear) [Apophysomyces ossiformis]|uniref:Target of EGR1, member 1 (Nuclear) n=1 Tax=Apophysomyces ossiformis TaxID=679940 RepID=A0A8H7BUP7_9FUNG|nr:Target of EGR1, member 1 (Nuclear) [Apophysomyces ossiformis]